MSRISEIQIHYESAWCDVMNKIFADFRNFRDEIQLISVPYEYIRGFKNATITYKTGGLGKLMDNEHQTWLCLKEHPCSNVGDWFCFVYNEHTEVFFFHNIHVSVCKNTHGYTKTFHSLCQTQSFSDSVYSWNIICKGLLWQGTPVHKSVWYSLSHTHTQTHIRTHRLLSHGHQTVVLGWLYKNVKYGVLKPVFSMF